MVLRTRGPRAIFTGHRLLLHVDFGDADKIGVFYGGSERPGFWGDLWEFVGICENLGGTDPLALWDQPQILVLLLHCPAVESS